MGGSGVVSWERLLSPAQGRLVVSDLPGWPMFTRGERERSGRFGLVCVVSDGLTGVKVATRVRRLVAMVAQVVMGVAGCGYGCWAVAHSSCSG